MSLPLWWYGEGDMKVRYDKDVDAMIIILSAKKLAYESEAENVIIGFSEDNEPIWVEILDFAKELLPKLPGIVK
jgi:uncharacterized protein YuzE